MKRARVVDTYTNADVNELLHCCDVKDLTDTLNTLKASGYELTTENVFYIAKRPAQLHEHALSRASRVYSGVLGATYNSVRPLIMAVQREHYNACQSLLREGAYPLLCDADGLSAMDYLGRCRGAEAVPLIKLFRKYSGFFQTALDQVLVYPRVREDILVAILESSPYNLCIRTQHLQDALQHGPAITNIIVNHGTASQLTFETLRITNRESVESVLRVSRIASAFEFCTSKTWLLNVSPDALTLLARYVGTRTFNFVPGHGTLLHWAMHSKSVDNLRAVMKAHVNPFVANYSEKRCPHELEECSGEMAFLLREYGQFQYTRHHALWYGLSVTRIFWTLLCIWMRYMPHYKMPVDIKNYLFRVVIATDPSLTYFARMIR